MPVVYEVNIDVDPSIAESYLQWLRPHCARMRDVLEGIEDIRICSRSRADSSPDGWMGYTITYLIRTDEALQDYLQNRSAAMREEAAKLFGDKYYGWRRILHML
jgi:hypothetical protein